MVSTSLGEYTQEIRCRSLDCFLLRGTHGPDPRLFLAGRNARAGPSSVSLAVRNARAGPSSVSRWEERTGRTLVCFSRCEERTGRTLVCFSLGGTHGPDPRLFLAERNARAGPSSVSLAVRNSRARPSSVSRWEELTGRTLVCFSLGGMHGPDPRLFLAERNSRAGPSSVSRLEECKGRTLVCFSLVGTHGPDPRLFQMSHVSYYAFTQYVNTQGRLSTSKI